MYHLEEDELTHLGQAIGDMESFDDLQLSSSDEGGVSCDPSCDLLSCDCPQLMTRRITSEGS